MRAPSRWPLILALAAGVLGVGTLSAAEQAYAVATGDSAASLAKKFYGDRELGDLLLRYNGKAGKMIHPGERLTIPFCEVYRARPGDTWSVLAKRKLGRAAASPALAELNGFPAGQPLRVGARIVIPVVLKYTLARGETLSSISDRFYGDTQKATILQAFSRIGDANRLAVGTPLEIPLVAFVRATPDRMVNDAKPPAAVAAPVPPASAPAVAAIPTTPPAEERRFELPLAAAERRFAEGDYDDARDTLEAMKGRVAGEGAAWDRHEWGQLMAFVYVALDRDDDACAAYGSMPPPAGPTSFDPDLVSPRIRSVLSSCPPPSASLGRLDNPGAPTQIPLHGDAQR